MTSESQPCLGAAVLMFKLLMSSWEKLAADVPCLKPWIDHALGWVYKYYQHMDSKNIYILAMCKFLISYSTNMTLSYYEPVVDPATCLAWIKCTWGTEYIMKAEELILEMVCHCTVHYMFLQNL